MTDVTLFFAGGRPREAESRIARGEHPRVDYLHLQQTYGAAITSFDDLPGHRALSAHWRLALMARAQGGGAALTTGEDIGLPLALLQRLTGGRRHVFIITHGSYLNSRKAAPAFRLLRGAARVTFLCLSESLRRRLIEDYGIPEARALGVGYGVDTKFFRPPAASPEPRLVAAAGMANRDYRSLVAATEGLDVRVHIAADSAWFRADLDITGQTLPGGVTVASCGDYVGLRALYARASLVVVPLYPAIHACGYAVIAEAMAMGRPVIATRTASPSDYVVEGETGFLVPPGDVAALRARIAELLARPDLAAWMGANARRRMERLFTVEAYNARVAAAVGLTVQPPAVPDQTHEQTHRTTCVG